MQTVAPDNLLYLTQLLKELFAGFRDDRELVQQFKGVLAACLCEAFEQLSSEGKLILRHQQQQHEMHDNEGSTNDGTPKIMSSRALRREELHHANKAGKGGIRLAPTEPTPKEATATEKLKPAARWDIDDCRSWLLEACQRIAQTWVEERKTNTTKKIPPGPIDELEGLLIDHAIRLCEYLEGELQSGKTSTTSNSKVATPRVNDMSKLSIKWQHAHERGSGGKGGVGGSGVASAKSRSGRTAGQILILKSAKKLGDILKDPLVGEAIHKELRSVIGKQETQKRQKLREEATQQRFTQMQRKPWLQARAQL